ncbi:MAG: glutathione S-transferase [Acinetobacter sp.]|jgi:glutathione S-transferase|nr:MAG: glutathione S-transferase [Acinetobacter sp.]
MLTLHHLEHSRSFRILWALEELGIPYELKYYTRRPNMAAPKELKQIHPLGKAPILTDGDLVIAESAVILEYLQTNYDPNHQFKPQSAQDLNQYHYWMHYAEGSLMPYLVFSLVMQQLGKKPVPMVARPLTGFVGQQVFKQFMQPRLNEHVDFLEQYLSQHDYFSGEFSFADIQMMFPLMGLLEMPNIHDLPHVRAFVEKMSVRPAFRAAQQKSPDGGKVI